MATVPLAHHFRTPAQQHHAALLGMWMFLITEVLLFGAVFLGYVVYRANPALHGGFVAASARMLQDCEERLRMGFDVLIFPEGTRTPMGGPLRPFHRGAEHARREPGW